MSDEEMDLDTRWIGDAEQDLDTRPETHIPVLQESITTTFVYINASNSIDKVISENHATILTENGHAVLPYQKVLQLIQTKKNTVAAKYKLTDILSYVFELQSSNIVHFANSDEFVELSKTYMKVCPTYEDVKIHASLKIFHNTNAIYFLFKEKQKISPKSILKTNGEGEPKKTKRYHNTHTHTKKVQWGEI